MKCRSPKCPNKARPSKNRGLCEKHYNLAPNKGYVSSLPARNRIKTLRFQGMTMHMLKEHGVSAFGVKCINTKPRILKMTEQKVFAIPMPREALTTCAPVDGVGTSRRLHALMALGYSTAMIGEELGTPQNAVSAMAKREFVTAATRAAVAELFERWCMTPGPSEITRRRARMSGYAPPLAWDDIDDPNAVPDVGEGRKWVPFMERYQELRDMNLTREVIAEKLGIQVESLERTLRRNALKETA